MRNKKKTKIRDPMKWEDDTPTLYAPRRLNIPDDLMARYRVVVAFFFEKKNKENHFFLFFIFLFHRQEVASGVTYIPDPSLSLSLS